MLAAAIVPVGARCAAAIPLTVIDLHRWAARVSASYMLIPVLVFLLVGTLGLILFVIALIRGRLWKRSVAAAREQAWGERHRPDGTPYPPSGRGMCDRCQRAFDKVYFLPGRRLCPDCLRAVEAEANAAAGADANKQEEAS